MADLISERDGHVATITLNRPDRMNAISGGMLMDLSAALLEADRDAEVRVIVLTGNGRAFCAGLDLVDASEGKGLGPAIGRRPGELDLRDAPPIVLHKIDTPTIASLNGGAAGYGFDLAMGCDLRVAGESAKLAAVFTKRGLVPESGGTWILPRLIGWAKASELCFGGRTLSAKEALDWGLVNRVVPDASLQEATAELAAEIAAAAPLAVRATKRMMRAGLTESFEDHVPRVFNQLMPLTHTKDFAEGMTSFLEKRPPDFKGE